MSKFAKSVEWAGREAVQKLAIVPWLECDRKCFQDGYTLCSSLREDFPAVTQLIFTGWNHDSYGESERSQLREMRVQQRTNSRKRVTLWKKLDPRTHRSFEAFIMDEIEDCCEKSGWTCPK